LCAARYDGHGVCTVNRLCSQSNVQNPFWNEDLLIEKVATKVAYNGDGSERRWVRQAVMGVLRWRDLPGARSSMGSTVVHREVYK